MIQQIVAEKGTKREKEILKDRSNKKFTHGVISYTTTGKTTFKFAVHQRVKIVEEDA